MLYKRIFREFLENKIAYISVALIVMLGLGCVLGGNSGDDSMIDAIEDFQNKNNVEDGFFVSYSELTDDIKQELENENVEIEESFYIDLETEGNTLRIMRLPESIDLPVTDEGKLPDNDDEIWIEKHYADRNQIKVADTDSDRINFDDISFKVVGSGSLPQYIYVLQNLTDLSSDTKNFSVALVTQKGYEKIISDSGISADKQVKQYVYKLKGNITSSDLKEKLLEDPSVFLLAFVNADNNYRINYYVADCALVKKATFIFALVFLVLMAYVISVFTLNRIEKESNYIGTLYALGYRRGEIIRHYLALPVISVFVGGVLSLIAGRFVFSYLLTKDSIDLYSIPDFNIHMPLYIVLFGLLVPTIITLMIGYVILGIKLSSSPLNLIKGTIRQGLKIRLSFSFLSYITRFRIRQFFREILGNIVLIIGMFSATVLLLLGVGIYGTISNYSDHIVDDVNYNYLYTLNAEMEDIPAGAEKIRIKNMTSYNSIADTDLDITMLGIDEKSSFFQLPEKIGKGEIIISDDVSEKYGIDIGDSITLYDSLEEKEYSFKVKAHVPYSVGLYVFIDYENMEDEIDGNITNGIVSDNEVEFSDDAMVVSTTKLEDYKGIANSMLESLMLFIIALVLSAAAIVGLVTYLMLKFMIDKAVFGISMLQIFGYLKKEVNKIYLGGEAITVIAAICISLYLGSFVVDRLMFYLTAGYSAMLHMHIEPVMYLYMALFELVVYIIIHLTQSRYISSIEYTDILKNRE